VSDPYEEPFAPEVRVDTSVVSIEEGVQQIEAHLRAIGLVTTNGASAATANAQ